MKKIIGLTLGMMFMLPTAQAATTSRIISDDVVVTNQALSILATIDSRDIFIELRDEYAVGDFVILLFPGELTTTADLATAVTVAPSGSLKGVTLDFILSDYDADADQTWVKYRVTELAGSGTTTVGVDLNMGSITLDASLLEGLTDYTASTISRTAYDNYPDAEGETPDPLDAAADNTAALFTIYEEFVWDDGNNGMDPNDSDRVFDETIDVIDNYRIDFVSGSVERLYWDIDRPDSSNYQPFDSNDKAPSFDFEVAVQSTQIVISGANMFSWLNDVDPNTAAIDVGGQITTSPLSGSCTPTVTVNDLTYDCTGSLSFESAIITLNLNGDKLVPSGEFKLDATISYEGLSVAQTGYTLKASPDNAGVHEMSQFDFGEWDINGSETKIPYMPYSAQATADAGSTGIDQILYVTNKSQKDYNDFVPPIYIDVMTESGEREHFTSDDLGGLTAGKGITKLAGALREAMFARGLLDESQKVSITVTVPENPANIEVYSAYNVGGSDRGWVQNDSQRVYGHDQNL